MREAVLEFKKLAKRLNTDRVESELLRAKMEKNTEEIKILEAAIRLAISNSRENAARCVANFLHARALNLTMSLVVNDSQPFILCIVHRILMEISDSSNSSEEYLAMSIGRASRRISL